MKGVLWGGKVYNSNIKKFEYANIYFEDSVIREIKSGEVNSAYGTLYDCRDLMLCPGYVDIHTHGARKLAFDDLCDFDESTVDTLIKHYLSHGVTSVFPTTTTMPVERIVADIECASKLSDTLPIRFAGFHVEGPYLSYAKRGAHNAQLLKSPEVSELEEMIKATGGKFGLRITVAPEIEGAMDYIKAATERGVKIVIGHTDADSTIVANSFANGADCMCHLYNAMSPLSHREPGAVGIALHNQNVFTEVICDGFHINPAVVALTFGIKAKNNRFVVITDSVSCAGVKEDFSFESAGLTVYYHDGKALLADGTIAGSTLNMHDGTKNLSAFASIPFEEALYYSTATPAMAAGVYDKVGSLECGKFADVVAMDADFDIKNVFVGGNKVI